MQPPKIKIQVKIDAEIDDIEEGTQQGVDDRDGHPTGTSVVVLEIRDKVYIVQPLR